MPNYEYQCNKCDDRFEIWQTVGAAAPECPACGSDVRKVFHPPRVIFKGSGFYVTDLRAEKEAKTAKAEAKSETKSESASSESGKSESAKTESAPAASNSDTKTPATTAA